MNGEYEKKEKEKKIRKLRIEDSENTGYRRLRKRDGLTK